MARNLLTITYPYFSLFRVGVSSTHTTHKIPLPSFMICRFNVSTYPVNFNLSMSHKIKTITSFVNTIPSIICFVTGISYIVRRLVVSDPLLVPKAIIFFKPELIQLYVNTIRSPLNTCFIIFNSNNNVEYCR